MRFNKLFLTLLTLAIFAASAKASGAPAQAARAGGQTVEVKLVDYKIEMPATVRAGLTTFKVINAGHHKHNLKIKGQGLNRKLASDLKDGQSGDLRLDLKPGTYEVTCPVGFHKKRGMSMQLTVTQ